MRILKHAAVSAFLASPAIAGTITTDHAFAFETPKLARAGGGFVTITNTGTEPDTLLRVEADFPKVEIHRTEMQDGRAMMRPAGEIEIAPGETLVLQPGGLHVMFMGLADPFESGGKVEVSLIFEHAGEITVTMPIVTRESVGTDEGMKHGEEDGMTHSAGDGS